jgi:DNA-binding GntR family transcriptional regulator
MMHELAVRAAVQLLTSAHIEAMREANRRFEAAISAADVDAALESDDDLHGVLISVCGNRAVAATIERYTPLIRRLERRQFSSARARRSVRRHDELIAACVAGDVGQAIQVTGQIWRSLEDLADYRSVH